MIDSVELLRIGRRHLVRVRSRDGASATVATTKRMQYLEGLFRQRVAPFFVGRDARDVETLADDVYRSGSNYKLAGLPFWCCVAWMEFALLELLGRTGGSAVHAMFGVQPRPAIPVYLSLLGRELSAPAVASLLQARLAATGAQAVKVKIGGRMLSDDAVPGRTDALIPLLRRELGDEVAIFVDANGSYDAARAIEVGRMLEEHGVGFFEEPCPFDHYGDTRRVAESLSMPVAGGEQDSSMQRWNENIATGVFDIAQPDIVYNGGLLRTLRVAAMAGAAGLPVSLHNPHPAPTSAYMLHLAAVLPLPALHHEWHATAVPPAWCDPGLDVRDGHVRLPMGPGFGVRIDRATLLRATLVEQLRSAARRVFGPARGGPRS